MIDIGKLRMTALIYENGRDSSYAMVMPHATRNQSDGGLLNKAAKEMEEAADEIKRLLAQRST